DSGGAPVAGKLLVIGSGPFRYRFGLVVGDDGRFTLPEVLAGPFTASLTVVDAAGFTLHGTAAGVVSPGQVLGADSPFVVQLQESGTVQGTVLRADHTPAYGATGTIELAADRGSVPQQAQKGGSFVAVGVPLGGLAVHVYDPITTGVGLVRARLDSNGQLLVLPDIVLDDTPIAVSSVEPADGALGI